MRIHGFLRPAISIRLQENYLLISSICLARARPQKAVDRNLQLSQNDCWDGHSKLSIPPSSISNLYLTMIGIIFIAAALLIAFLSLPMIYRKIPMNRFYGARFPQSFKSDDHWYEINHIGGKALLASSLPIAAVGLIGLFSGSSSDGYALAGSAVLVISAVAACCWSYFQARRIDKNLTNSSK